MTHFRCELYEKETAAIRLAALTLALALALALALVAFIS